MKEGGWMKKNRNIESETCLFVRLFFKSHYICNSNCDVT